MSPQKLLLAVAVGCSLNGLPEAGAESPDAGVERPNAAVQRPGPSAAATQSSAGATQQPSAVAPPLSAVAQSRDAAAQRPDKTVQRPNAAGHPKATVQRPNPTIQRRNKPAQRPMAALPRPHAAAVRPEATGRRPQTTALLPDTAAPQTPAIPRPKGPATQRANAQVQLANFAREQPARATRTIADWVVASKDNRGAAFFIIDKAHARLYVFDPAGRLQGASPILLGLARGDDSVPGIGDKPLAEIHSSERTTPAGRFVAQRGRNLKGEEIVWVDYAAAVSLHRVREVNPGENRVQRLKTPSIADNRISYGCINVPTWFYDRIVQRAWRSGGVVVYVLPERRPLDGVFPRQPSFEVASSLVRRSG